MRGAIVSFAVVRESLTDKVTLSRDLSEVKEQVMGNGEEFQVEGTACAEAQSLDRLI